MATKEAQSETEVGDEVGDDEDDKAPAEKRKLPLKLIAMAVGGLVVVGGVGWGPYHLLFAGRSDMAAAAPAQIKPPAFLDMPEVLVNLSTAGGNERTQYLKVKVG